MKYTSICYIPAKGNSVRIKNKNLLELPFIDNTHGIIPHSLVYWAAQKAVNSKIFDAVVVDTDSSEIIFSATKLGKNKGVGFTVRPKRLTLPGVTGNDVLMWEYEDLGRCFDYTFQLFCTAPFLKVDSISNMAYTLIHNDNIDSIFSAIKRKSYFWTKDMVPLYDKVSQPHGDNWPYLWEETFGFYGIKSELIPEIRSRIGYKPLAYEVTDIEATDINTWKDLETLATIGHKTKWSYLQ